MKLFVPILTLMLFTAFVTVKPSLVSNAIIFNTPASKGSLSFKLNGKLYVADSTHARGYANKQTLQAYINGANSEDMVMGIEIKNLKSTGVYMINSSAGKVDFTINHKTYTVLKPGDYLKITVTAVKQQSSFLLLNGLFEGSLQDKLGNKVVVTEGRFETNSL